MQLNALGKTIKLFKQEWQILKGTIDRLLKLILVTKLALFLTLELLPLNVVDDNLLSKYLKLIVGLAYS